VQQEIGLEQNNLFIFFSFAAAHKKKTHQVSDFFVQ
jgi:hypothetical protein